MKLVWYEGYYVSTVGADGLVLDQGNISDKAEYAPMRFQLFMA